jgi:hypothetical protein
MNACICDAEGKGRLIAPLGGLLMMLLLFGAAPVRAQSATTFKGTLADEQLNCIQNPVKAPLDIKDKTPCMLYFAHFVKPGSKYVLYDAATKTKYQLDDQDLVQPYLGAKEVQINGTLDAATKTIKVKEIKALETRGS